MRSKSWPWALRCAVSLGLVAGVVSHAAAQTDYPTRPIRMLIPYPAGGATDVIGRTIATALGQRMQHSVVVDNRPGAGGRLGADALAKAPADGYTVLITPASPITVAPALTHKLNYSPDQDLVPVTLVGEILNVMVVSPGTGVSTVREFIDWAKKRGKPVRYGSAGVGSVDHLAGEFFQRSTGLEMMHVPYKGGGVALLDLSAGLIDVAFSTYVVARPLAQGGRVKVIGVTSAKRQPLLPNVAAVSETVQGFALSSWAGVFVPKATPRPVVERLFSELNRVTRTDDVKAKLFEVGVDTAQSTSPEEFANFVRNDARQWRSIVKDANVPLE